MGFKLWSGATGVNNGTSWADAYTALDGLYAAETVGGDVDMATDHVDADNYWSASPANEEITPFHIRSINRANDQYTPGGTPQIDGSALSQSVNMSQFINALSGAYIKSKDGALLGKAGKDNSYRDTRVEIVTAYSNMVVEFTGRSMVADILRVDLPASGGTAFMRLSAKKVNISQLLLAGRGSGSYPALEVNAYDGVYRIFGLDASGVLNSPSLFGWSFADGFDLVVEGGTLRNGMALMSSEIPPNDAQRAVFSNVDLGDGVLRNAVYRRRGKMTTTTAVYKTNGYRHHLSNQSMARIASANSYCKESRPFAAQSFLVSTDTAGLHTFTLELLEDYTTALTTRDFYLRVEVPGSASGVLREVYDVALNPAANLTAGAGLGAWTNPPAGTRSVKATAEVVLDHAGMVKVTPVLARYEAGKSVWYDPVVAVA